MNDISTATTIGSVKYATISRPNRWKAMRPGDLNRPSSRAPGHPVASSELNAATTTAIIASTTNARAEAHRPVHVLERLLRHLHGHRLQIRIPEQMGRYECAEGPDDGDEQRDVRTRQAQRKGDRPERPRRARAHPPGGVAQGRVETVQRGGDDEDRIGNDQEHLAHGRGQQGVDQLDRLVDDAGGHEELVDPAVVGEQDLQPVHQHQDVAQLRKDHEDQQHDLQARPCLVDVVGHGVREQHRDDGHQQRELQREERDRSEILVGEDAAVVLQRPGSFDVVSAAGLPLGAPDAEAGRSAAPVQAHAKQPQQWSREEEHEHDEERAEQEILVAGPEAFEPRRLVRVARTHDSVPDVHDVIDVPGGEHPVARGEARLAGRNGFTRPDERGSASIRIM